MGGGKSGEKESPPCLTARMTPSYDRCHGEASPPRLNSELPTRLASISRLSAPLTVFVYVFSSPACRSAQALSSARALRSLCSRRSRSASRGTILLEVSASEWSQRGSPEGAPVVPRLLTDWNCMADAASLKVCSLC